MKAIGYRQSLPIEHAESLLDIELPEPSPGPRDLLVRVKAISVNPVDTKIRKRIKPGEGHYQVLGWDASGVVQAIGDEVKLFQPGDEVWYAGAIDRPGCNSKLHCVDERIVALKPKSLSFAQAAALPLTTITAWELLFDRLQLSQHERHQSESLLVIGAAGGVGSILIQLAKHLTPLTVIATASRDETRDWVKEMGADYVIDHTKPLSRELNNIGIANVAYVASLTHTDDHYPEIVKCLAPQGKLGLVDDPEELDIKLVKQKSVSIHWEFMYTRSLFATEDMIKQHQLLTEAANLVDGQQLRSTMKQCFEKINAENLKQAHAIIESGKAVGKIVLEHFY